MVTNQSLIQHLENSGVLVSLNIKKALKEVPRGEFVPEKFKDEAYGDYPLHIGEEQTISQPTTVIFMLELLEVKEGSKILETGAGSGWQTALLAELTGPKGHVYGFEILESVGEFGKRNLEKFDYQNVNYLIEDIEKAWNKFGSFDRIISGAAFESIPENLKQQLKIGGRLVTPTQEHDILLIVRKSESDFEEIIYPGFVFVPVTH